MSAISTLLTRLQNTLSTLHAAIWAIDVRDDIADAIEECGQMVEQCYSDVSNPTLQTEALEAALQNKIDQGEMAALTIGDRTITAVKLANGVIPAADATLTTSGGYADAAETGRQIGNIKADLGALTEPQRLADGTDLNTVTTPGTYTIHTGWTYTNKPTSDAEHGILEVWHEDYENNQGRVFQRLTYTYKAGRTCMEIWTRSLGVSTMTWTPWVSVVNADELNQKIDALMEPQRLADGTDLNNVTAPGTYTLHASVTYTNKPTEDAEHGILEVWHEDFDNNLGRIFQRLTYTYKAGRTKTEIWARSKATTAEAIWTPWISTTGDLTRKSMLLSDDVPNTTQSYTFTNGKVSQVTHSRNSVAIRTDTFTYGTGTITEVRTLNTGESLTIVTNLTTLETIVTYNGGV